MFESLYQSFEDRAEPSQGAIRIAALRGEFARLGLDGFLVPRADPHQNEYVAACEERLAWLSGFTGSAGLAIVLKGSAAVFVDGRYSPAAWEDARPLQHFPGRIRTAIRRTAREPIRTASA
ncbi:MAG: aminopeptidase P family N-terminal domain-containing protein, partial [Methylocella sp.]